MKKLVFHDNMDAQRDYGLNQSSNRSFIQRLADLLILNRKVFGQKENISKKTEIFTSKKGEDVNDFYKRINQ